MQKAAIRQLGSFFVGKFFMSSPNSDQPTVRAADSLLAFSCTYQRKCSFKRLSIIRVHERARSGANVTRYHGRMNEHSNTRVVVYGAGGRMGQSLIDAGRAFDGVSVVAALVRAQSHLLDAPLAGVFDATGNELNYLAALDPDIAVDVLIDFSAGAAFDNALAIAVEQRIAFVSGTTGLTPMQQQNLQHAATQIPLLWSANFSLGVALLKRLSAQAAAALGPEFEVEIVEAHHARKEDAPSGTALALGKAIAEARGQDIEQVARRARDGIVGARDPQEIGFSTIRGGDIIGEHTVMFIAPGERIELIHRAGSRDLFARGALRAAQWIKGRTPGLYSMEDVISSIA